MNVSPAAVGATPSGLMMIGRWDLLLRQPAFRTHDLEEGRAHMRRVLGEHGVAYCRVNVASVFPADVSHRYAKARIECPGAVRLKV